MSAKPGGGDYVPEPHPCGHMERMKGCGGCDPGAIEYVRDDGSDRWVRVDADPEADAGNMDNQGEELDRLRAENERLRAAPHYCGCAWCCAKNPPGTIAGSSHDICPAQKANRAALDGAE